MKNIQQKELASHLDISPNTLSQYINEKRTMSPEILSNIADYLGVTVDYLICKIGTIACPICHNTYDPLNKYDSAEHDVFHDKFTAAENKFGTILVYGEADQKRSDCIDKFRNPNLSLEEREAAFDDYLKYNYMLSIWRSNFDLSHDDFNSFCQKETSSLEIKDALQSITPQLRDSLIAKYKIKDTDLPAKRIELNQKDKKDIAKDLDNIMQKLQSGENGPATFDGQELSPESAELFKIQLESMLTQLKVINKEKYNPNKNKNKGLG